MDFDLKNLTPDIRHLGELEKVVYDRAWFSATSGSASGGKTAENVELYYMYRSLKVENGLRYDITVIPPRMLGEE